MEPVAPAVGIRPALVALRDVREGLHLFWEKFNDDDAFFLAGGIAWGVLFALVPLLALGIGLTGFVLSARYADPTEAVVALFAGAMPATGAAGSFADILRDLVGEVMANRTGLTVVGALVFVWLATRLSGSLRSALFRVFDTGVRRGIVHGKLFDILAVVAGTVAWMLGTPPNTGDVDPAPATSAASPSTSPRASASPTPDQTASPPPTVTAVVGYGEGVEGGTGGTVMAVSTSDKLVDALLTEGPRIVRFDVPATGSAGMVTFRGLGVVRSKPTTS